MNTREAAIAQSDIKHLTSELRSQFLLQQRNIPEALKNIRAWLLWKITKIDPTRGKFDKIPYYPTTRRKRNGIQGNPQDIRLLGTWDQVWEAFNNDKSFAGVGLAMLPDFNLTALDADNCVQHNDNVSTIKEEVLTLVSATYAEFSPSGNGVRAFWLGAANGGKNHPVGLELFHQNGFVTVTGNCLTAKEPIELSSDLKALLEKKIGSVGPVKQSFTSNVMIPPSLIPIYLKEVRSALGVIPSDDRELWIRMGLALSTLGDAANIVWHEWSSTSDKYDPDDAEQIWRSFKPNRIGHEAILAEARRRGWNDFIALPKMPMAGPAPKDPSRPTHQMPPAFAGVMSDIVNSALATAFKPQPDLTTLAVLIAMAAACDGNYCLPSGTRLNLYGLGVGTTGTGKDHTRHVAECLGKEVGAILLGEAGSSQGLEDSLLDRRALLSVIDEIAHTIAAVTDSSSPPHLKAVAGVLLKLFSVGRGSYPGRVLAGKSPKVVTHPCFNILGFATPEKLGDALKNGSVSDGLVGRMLMATADEKVPPTRKDNPFTIPASAASKIAEITRAGLARAINYTGEIKISLGPGTSELLDRLITELDQEQQLSTSDFERSLLVRSYEKVERIAGVLAVWERPAFPVMSPEHVDWALGFVRSSNATVRQFAGDHIHHGKVQADAAIVLKTITKILNGSYSTDRPSERSAIKHGYAPVSLVLKRSKLDKKDYSLAVDQLVTYGDLTPPFNYKIDTGCIRVVCFPPSEI